MSRAKFQFALYACCFLETYFYERVSATVAFSTGPEKCQLGEYLLHSCCSRKIAWSSVRCNIKARSYNKEEDSSHMFEGKGLDEATEFMNNPSDQVYSALSLQQGTSNQPLPSPGALSQVSLWHFVLLSHVTELLILFSVLALDLTVFITNLSSVYVVICYWTK